MVSKAVRLLNVVKLVIQDGQSGKQGQEVSWLALSSKILKWRLLYHEGQPAVMELPGQLKKAYVVNNY